MLHDLVHKHHALVHKHHPGHHLAKPQKHAWIITIQIWSWFLTPTAVLGGDRSNLVIITEASPSSSVISSSLLHGDRHWFANALLDLLQHFLVLEYHEEAKIG